MRLSPAPVRSRTRGARTGTGPRPVMIARSGRCPWRTSRWRPSPVCLSAWPLRKAATSASTACANSARAPSRRTSVSGSENSAGWISLTTLSWIMACHSFGGEVEVSNTPTIRRLIPHAVTNFRAYLLGSDLTFGELRRRNIIPIVDLCHFGVPDWIGDFQNPDFPELFAEYARAFAQRFPWVQLYTPVNEMFICAAFSAAFGWWNEQLTGDRAFVTALKHIVKANV